ncbi:hypothetical protein VOLCADRAFT_88778 [Volvox carteri f. nagariensis]|uniref:Uncharacterized protein n=1 Tax=Volvox carteri f. nagariensis TaxID=3068 RepID=D8TPX4_VOLCA|nr:uncharacterized protein VOLCADRAFT_88778 [Volvox carteri f. nagariensis]EFJ50303.1 hypothetical protein VOLCADRAFT_88778 [Volvox carteri f. nagariensis]|eukprot:XP_002948428.1 hypothetical protein VOLCADRAFT_88778 [Volvox carteri f. nagariensis]
MPDESDDEDSVDSEIAKAYYPSDNEEVESVASDEVYPSEETDDDVAGITEREMRCLSPDCHSSRVEGIKVLVLSSREAGIHGEDLPGRTAAIPMPAYWAEHSMQVRLQVLCITEIPIQQISCHAACPCPLGCLLPFLHSHPKT